MVNSKTYLRVPYAEKDAAKALGAKWDATKKRWYAPLNVEIEFFSKWMGEEVVAASTNKRKKAKASSLVDKAHLGTLTYAKDKNFVAYSGERPPWN